MSPVLGTDLCASHGRTLFLQWFSDNGTLIYGCGHCHHRETRKRNVQADALRQEALAQHRRALETIEAHVLSDCNDTCEYDDASKLLDEARLNRNPQEEDT